MLLLPAKRAGIQNGRLSRNCSRNTSDSRQRFE
jgi:hypothetical protein